MPMWPINPFKKYFCILFLSVAVLTTFISMRNNHKHFSDISLNNLTHDYDLLIFNESDIFFMDNDTSKPFFDIQRNFANLVNISSDKSIWNLEMPSNDIYILGLFELTNKWGRRIEGESEMSAAKLAVDHVNAINVLPGYTLKLLINDTKCDPGVGIDRFFHALYSKKTILMLLGAGCSNVSERLAHVVPYWNTIQISFGSTSPSLSDRNKFPLFFRTVAPDTSHNNAKIHFIKACGWSVVATFSQSENEYLLPVNHLVTDLENANVSCISTVTFSLDNYKEQLKVLKDLNVRIIIGSFSTTMATKIFCLVYEMDMYKNYVWILQNRDVHWWMDTRECLLRKMRKATEGIFMVSDFSKVSDETHLSFEKEFEDALNISKKYISRYAKQAYDAIWTIALTLRETEMFYWLDPLHEFEYTNKDMVCRWVKKMSSLSFVGLSGPVRFNGADRIGNSIIRQIQGKY